LVRRKTAPWWQRRRWRGPGLAGKFSLAAFCVLFGFLGIFTLFLLRHEQALLRHELTTKVRLLAHGVAHAAELGLLTENLSLQRESAHFPTLDPDVVAVQIYDRDHRLTVVEYGAGQEAWFAGLEMDSQRLLEAERVFSFPTAKHPILLGFRLDVEIPGHMLRDETLLLDTEAQAAEEVAKESVGAVQIWLSTARMAVVLREVTQRLLIATVVALGLIALVAIVTAAWLARPIQALVAATRRIAMGETVPPLPIRTHDEVGLLTHRFNALAASLADYRAQTAAQRSDLEHKVSERTADLELQRDKAQEAVRARAAFLANISHDLITPLNAVLGFTELLLNQDDSTLSEANRRDLSIIHHSASHLQDLIQQLLDYSRSEAGRLTLRLAPVQLLPILDQCLRSATVLKEGRAVELRRHLPSELPEVVGDAVRLRQAFLNVLSNAVKFTRDGYIAVTAYVDGDHVVCEIEDSGIGIAPEDHWKVFAEFVQIDDSLARPYEGLGLGMPITQEIIRQHGGTIRFESARGVGTRFFISLPIAPPDTTSSSPVEIP
jgi:signal transduction histidine kinase